MDKRLRELLVKRAEKEIKNEDPTHDILHALRVLAIAEKIADYEAADMDIVVPAALFHDVIVHLKNHPDSHNDADNSAEFVGEMLLEIEEYPNEKIEHVKRAIREHSFSKGIKPETIESMVVQDADRLEATGTVAIMRTFAHGGQMGVPFYHVSDPFCENREAEPLVYGLDLFFDRLLKVGEMMNTKYARKLAVKRTKFLYEFLDQLRDELR